MPGTPSANRKASRGTGGCPDDGKAKFCESIRLETGYRAIVTLVEPINAPGDLLPSDEDLETDIGRDCQVSRMLSLHVRGR